MPHCRGTLPVETSMSVSFNADGSPPASRMTLATLTMLPGKVPRSAVFPYNLGKYSLKINLPSTLLKHFGNEFLLDSSCPNLLHAIS
jgi:hypothetical protein